MEEEFDIVVAGVAENTLIALAEKAEKSLAAFQKIKGTVLKVTNAHDWVDQGGRPYLQASGGEKVARLFGISWTIGEPLLETEESGHFSYTYKGVFSLMGTSIEAIGTRSSKDGFFKRYGKQGDTLPPTEIDRGDVKKSAYTNLIGNGVSRLLGIRNLSWEELEAAGIHRGAKVEYRAKAEADKEPAWPPAPGLDSGSLRDEVIAELNRLCGADEEAIQKTLTECSGFEKSGRTYSIKVADIFAENADGTMKISDKWLWTTLSRLRKRNKELPF